MFNDESGMLLVVVLFFLFILGGMTMDHISEKKKYEVCAEIAETIEEFNKCVKP